MDLVISPAEQKDTDELNMLVNSAFRGPTSRLGWTTEADFLDGRRIDRDRLLGALARGPEEAILNLRLSDQGEIVGCVHLRFFKDTEGTGCHLGMLTIRPDMQDRGLGRELMAAAEDYARRGGACRMAMKVVQLRDTLIAWYERLGYRRTGETVAWPYGDERFGVPRRDDLHFVVFEKQLS
jgi:ribosomal protein S18 acetylase RimI-like enzyme